MYGVSTVLSVIKSRLNMNSKEASRISIGNVENSRKVRNSVKEKRYVIKNKKQRKETDPKHNHLRGNMMHHFVMPVMEGMRHLSTSTPERYRRDGI